MFEYITGDENEVTHKPDSMPTTAFVIVESEKGYMLLYNKYRHLRELTGGMLEQGESPKECAIRECREESNQNISNLKFVGLAKYVNMNAAIYYSFLNKEEPFVENDEIKELHWWKIGDEIIDYCDSSMEFIRLYNTTE